MSEKDVIVTKAFRTTLPNGFTLVQQSPATAVATADAGPELMQPPRITITAGTKSEFDLFSGNSFAEKYFNALPERRFRAVVTGTTETVVKDHVCYIVHGKTDTVFNDMRYDIRYFLACILLDGGYCIEFISEADTGVYAQFESSFRQAWEALSWDDNAGNLKQYLAEQDAEKAAAQKAWEDSLRKPEESKPENEPDIPAFDIPSDGRELFEIGNFSFNILQDESTWDIPAFSKTLNIRIAAVTSEVKKAVKARLLDEDAEGKTAAVHFEFPASGIYRHGIPTGVFDIKEDKCEAIYAHVRKEGFEYRLDFFGTITLKNNWVIYNGYLKPPYDNKPRFPVKICKKFDAAGLEWANYKFTSYDEAIQAPPAAVRCLYMNNPPFTVFPPEIFTFTNLAELVISCQWPMEKLPLQAIPEEIGDLQMLEQIAVNGTGFNTLPESIGQLGNLSRFYFNNGQLTAVPESLFRLPKLEHLMLSRHLLTTLPAEADLPAIKSLDFADNQLKTLPAALLRQGHLNNVDIRNNPLESLPAEINDIPNVNLSIEDKQRLMDFSYKGADGKGTVSWNNNAFFAEGDSALASRIETAFRENSVTTHQDALRSVVKKSVAFKLTAEEDYTATGRHRFGGMPDLPEHTGYPTFKQKTDDGEQEHPYEFIAQINCEDIAGLQEYLPRKGILFFFLETLHNIYHRSAHNPALVLHVQDTGLLVSGNRFRFDSSDYFDMYDPAYVANKAEAVKEISFPSCYASHDNPWMFQGPAAALANGEISDELSDQLFDTGANTKDYQHAVNVYGFTQHEAPELQASLKMKGKPEDWLILLQVSSSGSFMWGDAGKLFFVIHKSDLAKGDFSNVFVTLESS